MSYFTDKEGLMDDFTIIKGLYDVRFVNEKNERINVKENWINSQGIPLYIVDQTGVIYNWMTIISIKKVENNHG